MRSEREGVGVGVGVGVGGVEGLALDPETFTPLLHTSLAPDLMQVYRIPDETEVEPSLLQVAPDLVAALAGVLSWTRKSEAHTKAKKRDFITIY